MTTQTHQPRSLEDIYDATAPATVTPSDEAAPSETTGDQPAAEAAAAPAATTETAAAKEGAPPAPQTTEKPEGAWAPIKALQDERRKREKVEKDLEELRRAVKPEQTRGPDIPDPIVDPAGYANHIEERNFTRLVTASRADMIDEVGEEDFAAAEDAFKAAAAADPKLADRLWNSRDPARFAYNQGKKLIEQQETAAQASDPAAMRAQIKAELMAELGLAPAAAAQPGTGQPAAARSAPAAPAAQRPAVPRSLAGARSAPPRKAETAQPARRSLDQLYD